MWDCTLAEIASEAGIDMHNRTVSRQVLPEASEKVSATQPHTTLLLWPQFSTCLRNDGCDAFDFNQRTHGV